MAYILVIDDDLAIRVLINTALTYEGHEVDVLKNGLEGLSLMKSGKIPDLVLTDLNMDVMNGRDLIIKMRVDSQLHNIPAVIMTGSILTPGILPETDQFQGLLRKPFDIKDLITTVDSLTREVA